MKSRVSRLLGDLSGGLTGGVTAAAGNIPVGLIACAPLGSALSGAGVLAMFVGTIFSSAVFVALKRTPGLQAGGSVPIALVISGALSGLIEQGVLSPASPSVPQFLAITMLITGLASLCLGAIWLAGLGRVVPLIPYPVIAGVVNGGAVLMVLTQLRHGLGLEADASGPWPQGPWPHPGALLVTAITTALMLWPIHRIRFVPGVVIALLAGAASHYAIAASFPPGFAGPVIGTIPNAAQHVADLRAGWIEFPHLPLMTASVMLLPAAITIAVLATLETLMGASTMQDLTGTHRSAQPDLAGLAVANLVGGLLGGLPVSSGNNSTLAMWHAGGRTLVAGLVRSAIILAFVVLFANAMARLPFAVVSGIVVANAYRLFDRESVRLARLGIAARSWRGPLVTNLAIIAAVVLVATVFGMAFAVLVGGALSLVTFVIGMSQSVVRRSYIGGAGRSRTTRPTWEADALLTRASLIEVVELQGAIFFGSADQVGRRVEAALQRGARHVVLDARRVTSVDLSGARRLLQVSERFWRAGHDLSLASIRPGTPFWTSLQEYGLLPRLREDRIFAGLEEAVDHAERGVLAEAQVPPVDPLCAPASTLHALGLPAAIAQELAARLPVLHFGAGALIVRAGDPSDCLFVLLAGSIDVTLRVGREPHVQTTRVATLMPGLLVGEMGFLSGAPRSADVLARTAVTCQRIDAAVMDELRATSPAVAYDLMRTIATQIGHNLLVTNAALIAYEE